jgi:hypothetical protein
LKPEAKVDYMREYSKAYREQNREKLAAQKKGSTNSSKNGDLLIVWMAKRAAVCQK